VPPPPPRASWLVQGLGQGQGQVCDDGGLCRHLALPVRQSSVVVRCECVNLVVLLRLLLSLLLLLLLAAAVVACCCYC
jgi:hypothetical protein